jgi:hypothetical protein
MKLKTLLLAAFATSNCLAVPSSAEQARLQPLLPKNHNLVDSIKIQLQSKADTVAITEKDTKFYLFVVPKGAKAALPVTTLDKKNYLLAPVQGALHPKLSQLVYSRDLDHNGKPYLFVHTYLADASGIHVFKANPKGYQEVFQAGTISEFKVDPTGKKISRPASDADSAKTWTWKNGKFVESSPGSDADR